MMRAALIRITFVFAATTTLSACQTVRMPKIDIMKTPEFADDANNIGTEYPDVGEAPIAPADIRSDKQWDQDAKTIMALREPTPPPGDALTQAEIDARFANLVDEVQAYKEGDPPGGID